MAIKTRSVNDCRDDRPGEHLPGKSRLRYQTQSDVGALALKITLPLSYLLVLQPLINSEGVEEHKERDDDSDDKPGRRDIASCSSHAGCVQRGVTG